MELPGVGNKVLKEMKQYQDYILYSPLFLKVNFHAHSADVHVPVPMRSASTEKLRKIGFFRFVCAVNSAQIKKGTSTLHVIPYCQAEKRLEMKLKLPFSFC
jgi:hypothetical protein